MPTLSKRKFFKQIRSPSDWLFSGWNWVAKRLSRQIIEQKGASVVGFRGNHRRRLSGTT